MAGIQSHKGLVQIISLIKRVIFRFHVYCLEPLMYRCYFTQTTHLFQAISPCPHKGCGADESSQSLGTQTGAKNVKRWGRGHKQLMYFFEEVQIRLIWRLSDIVHIYMMCLYNLIVYIIYIFEYMTYHQWRCDHLDLLVDFVLVALAPGHIDDTWVAHLLPLGPLGSFGDASVAASLWVVPWFQTLKLTQWWNWG